MTTDPTDPVNRSGVKTSEFWMNVLGVISVAFSGWMRVRYGQGLNIEELALIGGIVGANWYGRTSLKKAIVKAQPKENGNAVSA